VGRAYGPGMAADEPLVVVQAFCDSVTELDLDVVMEFLAEDCVYHNIPMDPIVGIPDIRAFIESFTTGLDQLVFEMRNIAANGDVVLTERIDHFVKPDSTVSLPVMGTFEVADGKITAWRDYFDLNQFFTGGA
jgi:limonene-1,2-epoxide hydrolase